MIINRKKDENTNHSDHDYTGKTALAWAHQVSVSTDHSASRLSSSGDDFLSGT